MENEYGDEATKKGVDEMEVKFMLDDTQRQELKADLYEMGKETLERLKKEHHLQSQLMNKTQVCKFLNDCAPKTLNEYIKQGLPVHRIGKKTFLFDRDEVLEWVRNQ